MRRGFVSPFTLLFPTYHALIDLFNQWELPFIKRKNYSGNICLEVQRFHIWPYWRPMTVDRYHQLTLDYEGPHIPIFASRSKYRIDEEMVYEGYDFNMTRNHYYTYGDFYFVIPSFLLDRPWPMEREWLWQPAVKVTKATVRDILRLEVEYGGWRLNRRGMKMMPKKTGWSGKDSTITLRQGWATKNFEYFRISTEQQQDLL